MKTMTCAQMGGMCNAPISGATKEEMIANGMKHLQEAHPEMAASIQGMAADDPAMVDWQKKFDEEWDKTPEA